MNDYQRDKRKHVFLAIARELSRLSTCRKRQVGCILTDEFNRIIGSGYNGIASGIKHRCIQEGCIRETCAPGEDLLRCPAIHAEANALMHCTDIKQVRCAYIYGASPCIECAKLLCNSEVKTVYTDRLYSPQHVELVRMLFAEKGITLSVMSNEGELI